MKYLKRFNENEETNIDKKQFDFYKTEFISEEKAIVGAYFIIKESEKSIEVLNLKERPNHGATYMDGATPYTIGSVERCILPTSQIKIMEPVEDREGFFYIKIPYWLFKKNDGLSISRYNKMKRFDGGRTIEMLLRGSTPEYRKSYLSDMISEDVEKYLRASNKDKLFDSSYTSFKRSAKYWMNK